jgi:putative membrane-bound dehydrogenase-like protein
LNFARAAEEKLSLHEFQRRVLADKFYCEGASCGDFNRDGAVDLVAGPLLYFGPDFAQQREIYPAKSFDVEGYSDAFFDFPYDVDGDGWLDVVSVGFPGQQACWLRNPGQSAGTWERHVACEHVDNESPTFADLTGDGRPELVFHVGGQFGYAEVPRSSPERLWRFTPISPPSDRGPFTHGLGVGDLNGDGRSDVVEKDGWFEQPIDLSAGATWVHHDFRFAGPGGAQMLVDDLDGDGDADVITSIDAHGYGLSWFEQRRGSGGAVEFVEHRIMGERPEENEYGVAFSQLHALALADVDGDGLSDIVTGKRFWAHGTHDPGSLDPAVLYWFRTVRGQDGLHFVPHRIDDDSGVGTQLTVADVSGDKLPDVLVGNKKGVFVFTHQQRDVGRDEWEAAQPKASEPPADAAGAVAQADEKSDGGEAPLQTAAANESATLDPADAIPATDANGRRLNLDFESGDLQDWTAAGAAFDRQPIRGDTVALRRGDSASGHAGEFWIGTYELVQDGPQGTLTSVPFVATHPFASFLVGGGALDATKVEIVDQESGRTIFVAHGVDAEKMRRVVADLSDFVGKQIFVRITDAASGGWGHVNFDDFLFHAKKPALAAGPPAPPPGKLDEYPFAGLSAEDAVKNMKLPEGFRATVIAAEPDVQQPVAMAIDDRGRIWVAEAFEYPRRAEREEGRDRILIFEDTDGDGRSDSRKVFAEGLNLVSGLEVGFGGVWVGAAPYLYFIPDRDGDDRPDGKPEVMLDGWGYQDTHETLNTFTWGPDGWLYGCHGVFTHSRVGKPGTPDAQRTPINAGLWRYHPTRRLFEVFSEGTSNPWGVDFDDNGQAFCTACVIPHLYHMIQGCRYQRQAGEPFNPYTYDDVKTIADHVHFVGDWFSPHAGNNRSDSAGGGHAHAGAMIYQGGVWPQPYRGKLFMNNIHGNRLNCDSLPASGSGFVGRHEPDFLLTQDRASQIINLQYGPDGQMYMIDWYDMQACHDVNSDIHDRTNGRVYRVAYGDEKAPPTDLSQASDAELAELTLAPNEWHVRHARRLLQERAAAGRLSPAAAARLTEIATTHAEAPRRLRAMWALQAIGGLNDKLLEKLGRDEDPYVRAWTLQLAFDRESPPLASLVPRLVELARTDSSPVVRLYVASALQHVPAKDRWEAVTALASHKEDAEDHNLPLMVWYAAEPLVEVDPPRALALGLSMLDSMPKVGEFLLRRVGDLRTGQSLDLLAGAVGESTDAASQRALLAALQNAVKGRRQVAAPAGWSAAYSRLQSSAAPEVLRQATALGAVFGDDAALAELRRLVGDRTAPPNVRQDAIEALLGVKDAQLAGLLAALVDEPALRGVALRGLAAYDEPSAPAAILKVYASLAYQDRLTALATLASRASYAKALLQAMAEKSVPSTDLSAELIQRIRNLNDPEIERLAGEFWGQMRSTPADKAALVAAYRVLCATVDPYSADRELGRAVFARTCQQCHTLYGVGAKIGPDLTGSNRADKEYLLSNIVDPNALIAKEYQTTVVLTDDGRAISGIVTAEDAESITVKNSTETVVVPKDEILDQTLSDASLMPENQLAQFTNEEIRALVGYLGFKEQTPMLATKDTVGLLFNGVDLAGWHGEEGLWRVEDGQIVGDSGAGLARNSFLVSDLAVEDFRLTLEVRLKDDAGNSGIQFRSRSLDGVRELRGLQADVGPGWWGKLYEEHGRELLWDKSGEEHVRRGDWNKYVIEAVGPRIRTWINDQPCVDLTDDQAAHRGVIALQLHAGGPTEVRFRSLKLEALPAK